MCILFPAKDQWDWSKFRFVEPKFDISTLQPFDRVLTRDSKHEVWKANIFERAAARDSGSFFRYICFRGDSDHCIPYNDETKHLLGTDEMEPEFYQVDEYE